MGEIPVVIFKHKIQDLYTEVTKRTSYLGKMRGKDDVPHLLDRLSLTEGEDFLFYEFLDNAVYETYDWVKAFGREIPQSLYIVKDSKTVKAYKDWGIIVTYNGNTIPFDTETPLVLGAASQSGTDIIIPNTYTLNVKNAHPTYDTMVTALVTYKIFTLLDGTIPCEEERTFTQSIHLNYDSSGTISPTDTITDFQWTENYGGATHTHTLQKVEGSFKITRIKPLVSAVPLSAGTYVEYINPTDNSYELYLVDEDCIEAFFLQHSTLQTIDARDSVAFVLKRTRVFDNNLIAQIDRSIKEAIINHIIYQWFEYVNNEEAANFYAKFEISAQKAQLGMNSEKHILQRRYKLY